MTPGTAVKAWPETLTIPLSTSYHAKVRAILTAGSEWERKAEVEEGQWGDTQPPPPPGRVNRVFSLNPL
jgi:hypothetical protein